MSEVREFLERHLRSIFEADIDTYHATSASDLTLFEWYVTPHRIDGLPFHDFMMSESARPDTVTSALDPSPSNKPPQGKARLRFDLANYNEQFYGDTAICSYTMLISKGTSHGVTVLSYNESRVICKVEGQWTVVHVHKSPSWEAPFQPPRPPV